MSRRSAVWIGALLPLVVLLAGCTPQDRVMASLDDGELVFLSCYQITGVQHIRVNLDDGTAWHSRGEDGVFDRDTPVRYGVDPAGFTTDIGPGTFGLKDEKVSFSLVNTAVDTVAASFDTNKLVEGKRLDQNGNLHDKSCTL